MACKTNVGGASPDAAEESANGDEVDKLLEQWRSGDRKAMDSLFPLLYATLKDIANRNMRKERSDHTLQATVLVNEAYLQLVNTEMTWKDQTHFKSVAARVMRNILIDHARSRSSQKRGGEQARVTLLESQMGLAASPDVLDLDDALKRLGQFDARKAQVVELNFFGGLTYDEVAEVLSVSPATVDRELRMAKAWLTREFSAAS